MNNSKISGLLFLLLFSAYGYLAGDIPLDFWSEEELFNACSLLLITLPSAETYWRAMFELHWPPALQLLLAMSVYGIVFEYLGFIVATLLFLLAGFAILGERRPGLMLVAALLLGFILDGMLEDNLRRAVTLSDGELSFLWDRPTTLVLLILTTLVLLSPLVRFFLTRLVRGRGNL